MAGFEPYDRDAEAIEREIACRGMLLGIDWDDTAQLRLLATEMLDGGAELVQRLARSTPTRSLPSSRPRRCDGCARASSRSSRRRASRPACTCAARTRRSTRAWRCR